jgi:hypothetical protein
MVYGVLAEEFRLACGGLYIRHSALIDSAGWASYVGFARKSCIPENVTWPDFGIAYRRFRRGRGRVPSNLVPVLVPFDHDRSVPPESSEIAPEKGIKECVEYVSISEKKLKKPLFCDKIMDQT